MKLLNKVIVVTGAGGGIGRKIILQLLEKGARVAAVLNKSGFEEIQALGNVFGDKISIHISNLTIREEVEKLPEEILSVHGSVDGIINNAGIIQPFLNVNELDFERIKLVMDVNFYGTLYMCKVFLPHLLKREEGHITNISSMGGFLPVPRQSVYGASKAAVKLFTEGLYSELKETDVGVTVVLLGGVNTNIIQNSGAEREIVDSRKRMLLSAEGAAKLIIKGIENNKFRVIAGKDSKLMDIFYRINPIKATKLIAEKLK